MASSQDDACRKRTTGLPSGRSRAGLYFGGIVCVLLSLIAIPFAGVPLGLSTAAQGPLTAAVAMLFLSLHTTQTAPAARNHPGQLKEQLGSRR